MYLSYHTPLLTYLCTSLWTHISLPNTIGEINSKTSGCSIFRDSIMRNRDKVFQEHIIEKRLPKKNHRFVQLLLNLYSFSLGRYKQNVRINCYLKRVIGLNVSRSDDVSLLLTQLISKLPQSYRLILTSKISSWWLYVVEVLQQMFDKYNINMKSCTAVQQIKSVPWCLTYN